MNTIKVEILNETETGIASTLKSELYESPFLRPSGNFRVVDGVWSVKRGEGWLELVKVKHAGRYSTDCGCEGCADYMAGRIV